MVRFNLIMTFSNAFHPLAYVCPFSRREMLLWCPYPVRRHWMTARDKWWNTRPHGMQTGLIVSCTSRKSHQHGSEDHSIPADQGKCEGWHWKARKWMNSELDTCVDVHQGTNLNQRDPLKKKKLCMRSDMHTGHLPCHMLTRVRTPQIFSMVH